MTEPALPVGWLWRVDAGVLVIEHNGTPAGWVVVPDRFAAGWANRITRELANDKGDD